MGAFDFAAGGDGFAGFWVDGEAVIVDDVGEMLGTN